LSTSARASAVSLRATCSWRDSSSAGAVCLVKTRKRGCELARRCLARVVDLEEQRLELCHVALEAEDARVSSLGTRGSRSGITSSGLGP